MIELQTGRLLFQWRPVELVRRLDPLLETIMQTELYPALLRTDVSYLAETAVLYIVVGISVASNVEEVKEISAEPKHLFSPHVKLLE